MKPNRVVSYAAAFILLSTGSLSGRAFADVQLSDLIQGGYVRHGMPNPEDEHRRQATTEYSSEPARLPNPGLAPDQNPPAPEIANIGSEQESEVAVDRTQSGGVE